MATIDLTNEIEPKHPYRPLKTTLPDLRAAIKEADTEDAYTEDFLDKCNRNDLTNIARSLGVELPVRFTPADE